MFSKQFSLVFLMCCAHLVSGQNTVGTIVNTTGSDAGYTLISPFTNTQPNNTYLINNCGEVVNSWTTDFTGQGSDYLMEDGTLYRGAYNDQSSLFYFGNNGRLEHLDWDGNLIWEFNYSGANFGFHHDFTVMPNGNILLLVVERKNPEQTIQAGRDPNTLFQDDLYTEKVIEIQPQGANEATIVWEWDFWDHLVQDYDPTKDNFGVVADHPEKLDINYFAFGNYSDTNNADWIHTNGIDYNEELDQIVISARGTSEFYIIDHSTTTAQAATGSGGRSGKGGDFLYRWGNTAAYDRGTLADQKLFAQHAVHWIPEGQPNAGKLMVFNNGFSRGYSSVDLVEQPTPDSEGNYALGSTYEPDAATILYQDEEEPSNFYSAFVSSAYYTPNGNILIQSGTQNRLFEVDESGQIVWEYINPISINNGISDQGGSPPGPNDRRTFRARRYSPDFPGFSGLDLEPGPPIEGNPDLSNCTLLSVTHFDSSTAIRLYPNPAFEQATIVSSGNIDSYKLYDIHGKVVGQGTTSTIPTQALTPGLYIVVVQSGQNKQTLKLLKH